MAEYRGLTIRIGADTGKFTAAMKAVSSTINSTQYQLNQLKRALALDPGNTGTAKAYIGELQSQAVAARSKIAELSREMENIGGKKTKASTKYATIEELAKNTDDATLSAKRATEAYNNATEALAQWYDGLSKTNMAKDLGVTFNAKNNNIEDIRTVYEWMVESGEKTSEQAAAELAQLDRLKDGFKELKDAKSDADKVDAFHKDELAAAQLEAQLESLARAQTQATQDLVTNQFEESLSGIRNLSTELENAKKRFEHLDNALKLDPTNLDIARQRSEALAEVTRLAHDKAKALADAIASMDDTEFARIAETSGNLTEGLSKAKEAADKANEAVAKLRSKIDMNKEAMDDLAAKGDKGTEAFSKLASKTAELEDELDDAKQAADQATEALTQQVQATLFDSVKTDAAEATEEMARAAAEARTAREELSTSMFMALQEVGQEAKQALDDVVSATTSLDDSLTEVKKTVDTTEEGYENLKESAVELSKVQPINASTILQAEALGGQLGFMSDEVEKFAEVATGLDVATNMSWSDASTDMARFFNIMGLGHDEVENYGSAIVDLGNNYATTEQEISDMALRIAGAGASMNLGAADVLGLATALTSVGLSAEAGGSSISQIMVKIDKAVANGTAGIEGYAKQMGMSVDEFVTHLSSLDDDAFSDVAKSFGMTAKSFRADTLDSVDALKVWAETANMSSAEFVDAWENRPIEALKALFSGMDAAADEGSNLSLMLQDLGITTIRQSDVARRVANSSEQLVSAVDDANRAYEENTALSTEVERRNSSLSAQMDIMANSFDAVKAELGEGLLPIVKTGVSLFQDFSNVLNNVPTGVKTGIIATMGSLAAIGTTYPVIHQLTTAFGQLNEKIVAAGGLGKVISGILTPSNLAIAALGAIGVAAYSYYEKQAEARKRQEDFNSALEEVDEIASSMTSSMEAGKNAVSSFGEEVEVKAKSLEELTEDLNEFSDSIKNMMDPVDKSNALLGEYRSVIEKFGGVGKATGEDLAELEWAVKGINDTLGTNYTAQDILNDKYVTEEGEIDNLCAQIDKLIEKRQEQARVDAAQNMYTKSLEKQYELKMNVDFANEDLANFDKLVEERTAAFEELDNGVHTHEELVKAATRSVSEEMGATREQLEQNAEAAQRSLDTVDREVEYSKQLMADAMDDMGDNSETLASYIESAFQGWDIDWSDALERNGVSLDDFTQRAEAAGISIDDFKAIADDPDVFFSQWVDECEGDIDALIAKIQSYNGTKVENESIEGEAQRIRDFVDTAFQGWDIDWSDALERNGSTIDDFAQKAETAGITLGDLKAVAEDPGVTFAGWVDECEGDIDALIAKIQEYNETHFDEKVIEVKDAASDVIDNVNSRFGGGETIETTQKTTAVLDKDEAEASAKELTSTYDSVPDTVNTTATANTSDAERKLDYVITLANSVPSTVWININGDASSFYSKLAAAKAAGNAAGGIRYHADGVILNRPTWIGGRDIAGEAGAEAIIPLTNRRYVQPFADTVADGMMSKLGQMAGTTNNYVINGLTVAPDSALAKAMDATFDEAKRLSRMGRR